MQIDLRRAPGAVTAAVMAVCAIVLSPVLTYRMGLDQGVFAYVGAELLEGRWPYVATWDHAFPGAMVLHALEILLLGKSVALFRLFDFVYQLGVAYLIYRITLALAGRVGAFLAAVTYVLIYQGYGPWNTAQREGFALAFVLLGFQLYLTAERRSEVLTAAGIGLGLGIAVTIKPTLLALVAIYAPLLPQKKWRRAPVVLAGTAALLAPSLCVVVFYWIQDALVHLYEATIAYQLDVYVHRLRGDDPLWIHWLSKLRRLGFRTIALALVCPPFLFRGGARRERLMVYLGYLAAACTVFVQGTFAGYHHLPGLGLGAILIGCLFHQVSGRLLGERGRLVAASLVILAALPIYVEPDRVRNLVTLRFLERPAPEEFRVGTVFDFTESYDVAEYLSTHTGPEETVQVWGHESLVYFLAERDAASRFQTSNPLVMRVPGQDLTPMQQRWRREFLDDLERRTPSYVAVVHDDPWWWAPEEKSSAQLLDDFPEWKAFILDGYVLERTIGRFRVYRHKTSPKRDDHVSGR